MAIQLRGLINSSPEPIIDPTAGQVAYREGTRFNATYVRTCEANALMEKMQWQGCLIDRVFFFVIQKNSPAEDGQAIDLPTQVQELSLIIKASYNMEKVIRDFAESSEEQEQWYNSAASENYLKRDMLSACSSLQKCVHRIEKVAVQKLARIILLDTLPSVVIDLIDTCIY